MFCRLCLHKSETENFTHIFMVEDKTKWQELITQHLNLKIQQNDAHSKAICLACSKKLKEFHEFFKLVQNRQMLLLEIEANVQATTKSAETKAHSSMPATTTISCVPNTLQSELAETRGIAQISAGTIKTETFEHDMDTMDTSTPDNENSTFKTHKKIEEDLDKRTCVVCKKILISSNALRIHINDFHMQPLARQSNGKVMLNQLQFKNLPNACEVANKKPMETTESRDETADRTCILCNKTFKRMSTLLAHMKRFHPGVHPFECSTCGVKFLTHRGLDCHFEISKDCAKERLNINWNQQEFNFAKQLDSANAAYRTCSVCKRLFENWKYLEKHMFVKHNGIKTFHCKTCGQTFRLKLHFHNHLKNTPTCLKTT